MKAIQGNRQNPPKHDKAVASFVLVALIQTQRRIWAVMAKNPNKMARAFQQAVEAGRAAFEIGLAPEQLTANPTSPLTAFLNS